MITEQDIETYVATYVQRLENYERYTEGDAKRYDVSGIASALVRRYPITGESPAMNLSDISQCTLASVVYQHDTTRTEITATESPEDYGWFRTGAGHVRYMRRLLAEQL